MTAKRTPRAPGPVTDQIRADKGGVAQPTLHSTIDGPEVTLPPSGTTTSFAKHPLMPLKGDDRFHELLGELGDLHDKKQADYGNMNSPVNNLLAAQDLGLKPSLGVLLRMNDKMNRLKTFAQKRQLQNESAEDSLRDIAVYALLCITLLEEGK